MTTDIIMRREIYGDFISQKMQNGFFSQTDLFRIGNKSRADKGLKALQQDEYYMLKSSKEFIAELEKEFGKVKISTHGRGKHTWIHPLLFIDIALWLNPHLKIETYKWLFDCLLKYRNNSGDSFKKMCGALYVRANKTDFTKNIKKLCDVIKEECHVDDWNNAHEWQLELRDKIHDKIYILAEAMNNNKEAIKLGIILAKRDFIIPDELN